MRHPALSALTEAERHILEDLPPLTEAELKVLGPRYGRGVGMKIPPLDGFTLPEGVTHTCAEHMPCPACDAVEEEMARRAKIVTRCDDIIEVRDGHKDTGGWSGRLDAKRHSIQRSHGDRNH